MSSISHCLHRESFEWPIGFAITAAKLREIRLSFAERRPALLGQLRREWFKSEDTLSSIVTGDSRVLSRIGSHR